MIKNPNHPKKGSTIKVMPIKNEKDIKILKQILNPRDACLFTIGINTALRASDIVRIKTDQVVGIEPMADIDIKEKKAKKYKRVNLNESCVKAIDVYLETRESYSEWLFNNTQGGHLSVPYVSNMVKGWCKSLNLKGNYGSHTLRKTFGYMQRTKHNVGTPMLMVVFNHASERQTLDYLCVQSKEIRNIYGNII